MTRYLSIDTVRMILLSPESDSAIAKRIGRSRQSISMIRLGHSHAHVAPEIPRRRVKRPAQPGAPSCEACAFWRGDHCSMEFPDPIEEGPAFAAECSIYAPDRSQSSSLACAASDQ